MVRVPCRLPLVPSAATRPGFNLIQTPVRVTQDIPWTQWELRFGGTRVLLIARGDCFLGTDLQLAKYEQVQPAEKTATLSLP